MKFLEIVKEKARQSPKRIVFPEIFDDRTFPAVLKIIEEGTALPILSGSPERILSDLQKQTSPKNLEQWIEGKRLILWDNRGAETKKRYARALYELRKHKGISEKEAFGLMENHNYYGIMMVHMGDADGLISGASCPTADTLRPALQIIKTKAPFHKVSGFFFMVLEERLLLFADCAVNIEPNSHELADIAIDTAETAKRFSIEPRIAMLSFSTAGSAKHPTVEKVREATAIVRHFHPELIVDGEMQVDAALVPEVCARKYHNAVVKGNANILIFPDLEAANIAYKLVERLAHAKAIGPILQGLKKPVNDLSRGCSVEDIVNLAAITTIEALEAPLTLPEKLKSIL